MKLLAISGSLKHSSNNSALVRALASADPTVDVQIWDDLDGVPHFSPDRPPNRHVESLRNAVASADAVLIATPEYAGGMPGSLKNALDWLVGSGELYGKRVVVVSAAPDEGRGHNARRWVADVVAMQGATVADSFTVAIRSAPGGGDVAAHAGAALQRARRALSDSEHDH